MCRYRYGIVQTQLIIRDTLHEQIGGPGHITILCYGSYIYDSESLIRKYSCC